MELENDMTIFKYLKPNDNLILSSMNSDDVKDILLLIDRYYLDL